jgi:hypothetical protein
MTLWTYGSNTRLSPSEWLERMNREEEAITLLVEAGQAWHEIEIKWEMLSQILPKRL